MVTPSSRCTCGHVKLHHGSGAYGSTLDCGIEGCECRRFVEYTEPREPRPKTVKPLDRDDPKMFEVA